MSRQTNTTQQSHHAKEARAIRVPWLAAFALIAFAIAMRLLPHPPNFTPIGGLALFSGMYLPRRWALSAPLAAMAVSDALIGFYSLPILLSVYGSFGVILLIGMWLKRRRRIMPVLSGVISGAVIFYLVTNAAVWAFSGMYPPTFSGLMASYVAAIPFFRMTLASTLLYTAAFVSTAELAIRLASLKHSGSTLKHQSTETLKHINTRASLSNTKTGTQTH